MKLKTTLIGYGVLSVCTTLILGGIGYWAAAELNSSGEQIVASSKTLYASMQGDQAHDALRASVYAHVLAVQDVDAATLKAADNEIEKYSKIFQDSMNIVANINTSELIKEDLRATRPKIDSYIAMAKAFITDAAKLNTAKLPKQKNSMSMAINKSQTNTINAQLPAFLNQFSMLEKEMGKLSDDIENFNDETQISADKIAKSVKKIIIICGILASFLLILLATLVVRAIIIPLNAALKVADTVATGNLTSHIETSSKNEIGQLLIALNLMQNNLHNLVLKIKNSTYVIQIGAQEISAGNTDLSQRTEEQASSLEETASSMEQMASTVKQNAENAKQANIMAAEASAVAIKGGTVVSNVVRTMAEINTSSKKIADIISVIDGIAFQTNILALNAAVEAARAGEQGRGFAVVAAEVRSLAQRSAAAAKEIKQLIGDSVDKVADGMHLVQQAGGTMDEIVMAVKSVTDIVNEIAAASQEQSTGIDQVNNAITNMDEVTQQNAAMVEQAAAAANSLEAKAQELTNATNQFTLGDSIDYRALKQQDNQLGKQQQEHLNEVNVKRGELPKTKQTRLKPPKANKEEDWEEF